MTTKIQPNITINRGWDDPQRYVWSPFVTKLEFRLRDSNIRYQNTAGSMHSAPKGKIPYIEISYPDQPSEFVADSSLIIKTLTQNGVIADVNASLSERDKGVDLAIRALLEDKLYFFHTHERWIRNYYAMRDHAMWSIPYPMRVIVGLLAYRGNVQKLHDQGTGRFSNEEILGFKREIWSAIAGMLNDSKKKRKQNECFWILGGETATEADATLFGFIISVLVCHAAPESLELVKTEFPILVEYAKQIHDEMFPDYEIWKD
jgi:Glutathione S-transferase N-terminal domain